MPWAGAKVRAPRREQVPEDAMYIFLIFFHLLVCLALVGVVLMQSGKGGGLAGGAFGGSAQTVFGGRGATDFMTRATMVLGGLFFATSLVLALMSSSLSSTRSKSLINQEARKAAAGAPARLPQSGAGGGAQAPATTPAPVAPAPAAPAGGR
jgi:preprotein translocase subunit SecG